MQSAKVLAESAHSSLPNGVPGLSRQACIPHDSFEEFAMLEERERILHPHNDVQANRRMAMDFFIRVFSYGFFLFYHVWIAKTFLEMFRFAQHDDFGEFIAKSWDAMSRFNRQKGVLS
ncbi:MAG: hypothetical protein AB7T49_01045 [Oligoflexales bacterium]